jgi:hypothetical protein
MINLSIAMKRAIINVLLLVFALKSQTAQAQGETQPFIAAPTEGQIVQGLVLVSGPSRPDFRHTTGLCVCPR